jgi:hypothetical protein
MKPKVDRSYMFITDGSHGWIRVPYEDLKLLQIEDQITEYSYAGDNYAFLEEDCDGMTFCRAFKRHHGTDPCLIEQYDTMFSAIKTLNRYGHKS